MKTKQLMMAIPVMAILCMASVLAATCDWNTFEPISKFSYSASGGTLNNIGSYSSFTFTKASADLWSNGEWQSLGTVSLSARTTSGKLVNLNLHLEPMALVCDDGVWSYEYLARGTYWENNKKPKQIYVWVDYVINQNATKISLTGEGSNGFTFKVTDMALTSKI